MIENMSRTLSRLKPKTTPLQIEGNSNKLEWGHPIIRKVGEDNLPHETNKHQKETLNKLIFTIFKRVKYSKLHPFMN